MYEFWRKWFVAAAAFVTLSGAAMAVVALTPARWLLTWHVDGAFWPAGVPAGAAASQAFVVGILGAVLAGWGVTVWSLGRHPLAKREKWAWTTALVAIDVWFVLDCTGSAVTGAWGNVALNVGFLALLLPPLIGMRGALRSAAPSGRPAVA